MSDPYQDPFLAEVREHVRSALAAKPEVNADPILSNMTTPPNFELGQAALPCHSLAKTFRASPVKIAQDLAADILKRPLKFISKIDVVNAYLNFHANLKEYGSYLFKSVHSDYFSQGLLDSALREKILVEYSQPNTHKALHVGHLRNVVYGDSVCNLLKYAGHEVVRATYPGDLGAHIAKSLWYIKTIKKDAIPHGNEADWLGEMYAESDDYLKSLAGTSDESKAKSQIGDVLKQLQDQS